MGDPAATCSRIKPKAQSLVKPRGRLGLAAFAAGLCWLLALTALTPLALAEEPPPTPSPTHTAPTPEEAALPDIEAKTYELKVVRRSGNNRVYLLEDNTGGNPVIGRILLLKKESDPVMAFRVLKQYPEKKQLAAKKLRRYGTYHILDDGSGYLAVEKVSDLAPPPPTEQDNADLRELEGPPSNLPLPPASTGTAPNVLPFDPELDAGTTPTPPKSPDAGDKDDEDDEENLEPQLGMIIDEVQPLDIHRHWLSGQFGFFRNNAPPSSGGVIYLQAGGLRYGFTLSKMLFLRRARIQDSVALEAGAFLFKAVPYEASLNDAYTVMPLLGTVRYNINLGDSFGVFFYGGIMQNFVLSSVNGTDANIAALNSTTPAGGAGLMFQIGPSWDVRVDLGIDVIGTGLMLRF